ncbi:inactive protein RESTRICTED TEV MOVEMENT 2-like [Mangifera indica]|uniref:inactive protein RESTRICTED TEV MOVEMENT 2-like n=1 Tax=Mangifera indica TaxID=29780 RepID=UPI001CFAC8DA|nr:inactive protein RESTRICTED TEV MOVEMENT 2-like [Mangifera indica]
MAKRPQSPMFDHKLITYENFPPLTDWTEDKDNHYLTVHVPQFTKEQISIRCARSPGIVRIQGERQVADNRWSRFNQAYTIPKNCIPDKVQATWLEEDEIVLITMPKEIVAAPPPVAAPKNQPKTPAEAQTIKQEQSPPKAPSSSYNIDGKKQGGELIKAQKPEKKETTPAQKDQPKTAPESPAVIASTLKKNDDRGMLKADPSDEQTSKEFEKVTAASSEKESKEEKDKSTDKKLEDVKGLAMEKKEERQAMLNMGVAVLVLVAFGAYVSYTIVSKAKEN